jgi:benzil reductase ((S)-benzoin forming)
MTIAYIVTGTTRGIGRALARRIVAGGDKLYSLSSADTDVTGAWHNIQCDLGDSVGVSAACERLIQSIPMKKVRSLVLINNAGVLEPIGPIETATDAQIVHHINVNVLAPAVLVAAFIRQTAGLGIGRRIINISSGAARHPYAGWTMYCSAKASLEMMTRCVAAEQTAQDDSVALCAVSPGLVETRMQRLIRDANPDQFPARPKFISAQQSGNVKTPEQVADILLDLDRMGQLQNGQLYDLRDVQQHAGRLSIDPI